MGRAVAGVPVRVDPRVEVLVYIPRLTDGLLSDYLDTFGAILVEGPKWCGKSTSAARLAASELGIADPANMYQNKRLAENDVATALEGARPRLIDEWQEVPATWDAVRYECDRAGGLPGQFILTGSATPREANAPIHSGAGRIGRVRMDTLTLQELGVSSGVTSLRGLFGGDVPRGVSNLTLSRVAELACHGGWPAAARLDVRQAMRIASSYVDAVVGEDLVRMDGVSRNPDRVRRLVVSLARNEATLATRKTIAADTSAAGAPALSARTVGDYLSALEKLFLTDDIPAWNPALRSPVRIRAARKHHLVDPSLAVAALGAAPETLLDDLKTLGFLFESLVTHDLLVYARVQGATVSHYRDDSDLEVDLIVQQSEGAWGAFEVKLGASQEDEGAKNVCALERKMVERGERPAAVKAVIVGVGGVARMRPDGVAVVPLDTLGV